MSGPIGPDEVQADLPDVVWDVFNKLISRGWNGHQAIIKQADAIAALLAADPDLTREQIFADHLLDVEGGYRSKWAVYYHQPVYYAGEDFDPYWIFTRKIQTCG